jgi:tail protein P2 I
MIDVFNEVFNDDLPGSISYDPKVQTIGDVSDLRSRPLLPIIDQLRVLSNIMGQPEAILDLLAFQFQVLFYSGTYNITDPVARLAAKQSLIANSFDFHAHLGTPNTMQTIISTIYQAALIQEWFTYGGTANHYRILFPVVIDGPTQALIGATQRIIKRASQAFDGFFVYNVAGPENLYVAVGVFTQIWQTLPVGRVGLVGSLLGGRASVGANATIQKSSSFLTIGIGASIFANPRQLVAGAMNAHVFSATTLTITALILRRVTSIIRAGR